MKSLFLSTFLLFFLQTFSATIEVCPSCKISTVKAAVELANAGDVIVVMEGTYKENDIVIEKPLHIKGRNFPLIDSENGGEIFTIKSDNVTIEGLEIANVATSYIKDHAGIAVVESNNCTIRNNRFTLTFFAVFLSKSSNILVENNKMTSNATVETASGNGVHLWNCESITIKNNEITGHRDGIYIEFSTNSITSGNLSYKNLRYGLHFMFSNDNEYRNNTFDKNGAGVAVMYSKNIDMYHNKFLNNWGAAAYGILLKDITDSNIRKNTFRNNTVAIHAEGSNRINIENNIISNNGWAVKIMGNCEDIVFAENNFYSNSFNVSTNSRRSMNKFAGNYWSDYSGYDLDKDGIGDIPYRPVTLFSYLAEKNPPVIILMRSLLAGLLNMAEKITPVITPVELVDERPLMKPIIWN